MAAMAQWGIGQKQRSAGYRGRLQHGEYAKWGGNPLHIALLNRGSATGWR